MQQTAYCKGFLGLVVGWVLAGLGGCVFGQQRCCPRLPAFAAGTPAGECVFIQAQGGGLLVRGLYAASGSPHFAPCVNLLGRVYAGIFAALGLLY